MTLLITILAIINMAAGYGLAVYLGQGQPIQIKLGRFRKPKSTVVASPAVEAEEEHYAEPSVENTSSQQADELEAAEQTPIPKQVPQLDVKDLMPDAGTKVVTDEPGAATAPEVPPELNKAVQELADASPEKAAELPTAASPVTEEADDKESIEESADEVAEEISENDTEAVAEEVLAEEMAEQTEESDVVATDEPKKNVEAAAAEQSEPESEANELASLAQELDTAEEEVNTVEDQDPIDDTTPAELEAVDSLENSTSAEEIVEQQAKASDASEGIDANADSDLTAESEPVEAVAAADVLSGLESFQQQLQQQTEGEPAGTLASDSQPAATVEPEGTEVEDDALGGIEAFQTQLQQQAQAVEAESEEPEVNELEPEVATEANVNSDEDFRKEVVAQNTEETVLEGIESFQAQLQSQQPADDDVQPDEATSASTETEDDSLAPEVLAGIDSFRDQLAQLNDPVASTSADDPKKNLEAAETN